MREELIRLIEEEIPSYGVRMLGSLDCREYIKEFDNWVWKLRAILSPDSPCPNCIHRDYCIEDGQSNPHRVTSCTGFEELTQDETK